MNKPELGVKRRCLSCSKAFFDLNRTPIVCPSCKTAFQVVEMPHSAPRRGFAASPAFSRRPMPDPASPPIEAAEDEDTTPAEIEDVEAEEVEIEEVEDEEQAEIKSLI